MSSTRTAGGYTLIEMIFSIAILTLMLAIFVGTYSFGKNFDALKSETQRMASVLRNVRIRDFNGVVQRTRICEGGGLPKPCTQNSDCTPQNCGTAATTDLYPSGGYGIHIDTNFLVCSNNEKKSCQVAADCPGGACSVSSGQTNYILFADFANTDGGSYYDGSKTGTEFIEEYKLPAGLTLTRQVDASPAVTIDEADIIFKGSAVTVYTNSDWTTPVTGNAHTLFVEHTSGCAATRNQKGSVILDATLTGSRISSDLISC